MMPRLPMRRASLAAACAVAMPLCSCGHAPEYAGRVIVDLNRTACGEARLSSVLADSGREALLRPDVNGVYSFVSDTLPADIYVLSIDSVHRLPIVVSPGRGQKVCGTLREWGSLSTSDAETAAALAAERLRLRLSAARDTSLPAAALATSDGRRRAADSLMSVRASARVEADMLLRGLADTSLASLPILSLPGIYAADSDNQMLLRRMTALAGRFPGVSVLSSRRDFLGSVSRLNGLRRRYSAGEPWPDFLFVSAAGDSLSAADVAGKPVALALLADSVSTPAKSAARVGRIAASGVRVLIEAADSEAAPAARNIVFGRFERLELKRDLEMFRPAIVSCGKDGTVDGLTIDK